MMTVIVIGCLLILVASAVSGFMFYIWGYSRGYRDADKRHDGFKPAE